MRLLEIEADGQAYQALVGPLEQAKGRLDELCGGRPLTVVTDKKVWALHGERLNQVHAVEPLFVPAGEEAKSWGNLEALLHSFAERGLTRSTPVMAFGGGSIGDLTGLAAGLFKRGCPIIHVPTTLLAQVDSAIGGKTAIDFAGQKNVIGLFHQPSFVVADPSLLDTLDGRQMRAGYAELIKYGLIGDPPVYEFAEREADEILSGDPALRRRAVDTAIRCKAYYVGKDPEDRTGFRALLNFGHTFGHAVEALTGFGPILHGEAVAIGMALAFGLSAELGHCPGDDANRVIAHLRSVGLPTTLQEAGVAGRGVELAALMASDKKADALGPKLILTRGIGRAFIANVGVEQLASFLNRAA
jgi:3-dehydroquinate synthase